MIIEIRHYTLKPGRREDFIAYFAEKNRPALRDAGMLVFGPMKDLEDDNKVHWMRAFTTLESREEIKDAFYNGPVWNESIEAEVMPMIERFEADLVETTAGFEGFSGEQVFTEAKTD
jgi:hypothetical protein